MAWNCNHALLVNFVYCTWVGEALQNRPSRTLFQRESCEICGNTPQFPRLATDRAAVTNGHHNSHRISCRYCLCTLCCFFRGRRRGRSFTPRCANVRWSLQPDPWPGAEAVTKYSSTARLWYELEITKQQYVVMIPCYSSSDVIWKKQPSDSEQVRISWDIPA